MKTSSNRYINLKNYINTHDTITEDVMYSLSFNNPQGVLNRYTKKHNVIFEYIGNDTWVVIK